MTLITLIVWVVIIGLIWLLIMRYVPMQAPVPMIVNVLFAILLILVLLSGLFGIGGMHLPALRL